MAIDAVGSVGAIGGVAAGGTGYQVNDQLYDGYGGILLVSAVSSGAVTTAAYIAGREPYVFATPPANPLATTGGSGSGATVNVTWTAKTVLAIQPSGGTVAVTGTTSFANGANWGAQVGGTNYDLSKHIALHTAGYGLSVTPGRQNYVAPGSHVFVCNNADVVTMATSGATTFASGIGAFGTSALTAKPTVTGAKGGNAALASLLTALASYGLILDSTS
jgi:hypothetical protein